MPSTTNPYEPHVKALIERHAKDAQALAGLTRQTPPMYSITSALSDLLNKTRSTEGWGVKELSSSIVEQWGTQSRGLLIPFDKLLSRDLSMTTSASGGALASEYFTGGIIDAVRPASAVLAAGATVIEGIRGSKLIIPRWDDTTTLAWVGESSPAPATVPSFSQLVIVPRTLCATVTVSHQLIRDATLAGGFEFALREQLLRAAMSEIDRAALAGSGIDAEPLGLLNNADVGVVSLGTDGGPLTWAKLAEIEDTIASANTETTSTSWITNSAVRRKLRNTARGTGLDYILTGNDLMGRRAIVSEHMPNNLSKGGGGNLSAAVMGNFTDIIIGFFGPPAMDVIMHPRNFNEVKITAFVEVGVGVRRVQSFAICKDIVTT
ncbi:phage major capsid protein [Rhodocyclaceae bacterium SMB388]